ncbi:hypothetical protein JTE90_020529 [Oedothorax gibbosus]|uniref:Uncharacterized protein n=1 Tax=Oedothorax gibbosus TaxID=931172 RepID=A0AAV6VYT4_9ARAC|nr:hypothetical protein JTE90_020529 [Oedothorax gibbosus]
MPIAEIPGSGLRLVFPIHGKGAIGDAWVPTKPFRHHSCHLICSRDLASTEECISNGGFSKNRWSRFPVYA